MDSLKDILVETNRTEVDGLFFNNLCILMAIWCVLPVPQWDITNVL